MPSKKKPVVKTRRNQANPVKRVELSPRTASHDERAKGPKQRGFFKYRDVFPGEEGIPEFAKGGAAREVPMLPSESDAGRMSHRMRRGADPVEDDFVYEEYPERDRPYRPMKHDLTTAGGGKHGLLFEDVDRLYEELDNLANALVPAINEGLQDEEERTASLEEAVQYMEDRFNNWLEHVEDDDLLAIANDKPALATMLTAIQDGVEDDNGEYMAKAVEALRNRANWSFRSGKKRSADWSEEDDEHHVTFVPDSLVVDVDVINIVTGETISLNTGEDVIMHARDLFQIIEGDEGLGQEALELWLKDIVSKSDASEVEVKWRKQSTRWGWQGRLKEPIAVEIPDAQFKGYITVYGHANITTRDMENDLQEILDEIEALPDADAVEDETEPDAVAKRERVAARSDKTVQLPFVFDAVLDTNGNQAGADWTVWNLSSADLKSEGRAMAHCSGDEGMKYAAAIESGDVWIWSVRGGDGRGGVGKSKFTLQVQRGKGEHKDDVIGYAQVKGKGNRLPGWTFARDYPPYGHHAYEPRVEPYEEKTKAGIVVHPGITVDDVRREEVLLLWQLIKQAAPLEGLVAGRSLYNGPQTWDEVEDILVNNTENSYDGALMREPARKVLEIWCKDMLPGLYAVFSGVLFNDPRRTNPRTNPRRGRSVPVRKMQGTSFDHPYDRFANRWMR